MVKEAPNISIVSAKINRIEETGQPNIFLAKLEILSSDTVEGYQNFLSKQVKKTIHARIYSTKKLEPSQTPVRIILKYHGDEHGGEFYGSIE
jgi:hypothetical protein